MYDSILEQRKLKYMNTSLINILEARENYNLSLRKNEIEKFLYSKRGIYKNLNSSVHEINQDKLNIPLAIKNLKFEEYEELIEFIRTYLYDENIDILKFGINSLRIKINNIPPKKIDSYFIETLNIILEKHEDFLIQIETLWCLNNLASGDETYISDLLSEDKLMRKYENYINRYDKTDAILIENVISVIGNIVDSKIFREKLTNTNILCKLLEILSMEMINRDILNNTIFFISMIVKYKVNLNDEEIESITNYFIYFCKTYEVELLDLCIWGIYYLSELDNISVMNQIVNSNILKFLIDFDFSKYVQFHNPVLRIIGNVLIYDSSIDSLLQIGITDYLKLFLTNNNHDIRQLCIWISCNIIQSYEFSNIFYLIDSGLISKILECVNDRSYKVVSEVCFVIGILSTFNDYDLIMSLLKCGLINKMIYILRNYKEPLILKLIFESLINYLNCENMREENIFKKYFLDNGGLDIIENLNHPNDEIVYYLNLLCEKYFKD